MYKGVKCKIYPNQRQVYQIEQTFGCTRKVWNDFLGMLNERYQNNKDLNMLNFTKMSCLLTTYKKQYDFLSDVDSVALQETVKTLSETFDRFFKKTSKYPKFKKKHTSHQSYTSTIRGTNIRFNDRQTYIKLPKLGWVKCRTSIRHIQEGNIKSVTVRRNASGQYHISLLLEYENQVPLQKTGRSVGIDLGLTHLAITSDGRKYDSQCLHRRFQKRLHHWEKKMSRRRQNAMKNGIPLEDAKNYQKARRQIARLHQKIKDIRTDYLHQITTSLVEDYDLIVMEDLRTSHLMKNHKLARSIANQSWYQFKMMIQYKCDRYGKTAMFVNPYKTSQLCSHCCHDGGKKELHIRYWTCSSCGTHHDRDINAGKNILNIGLEQTLVKQLKPLI